MVLCDVVLYLVLKVFFVQKMINSGWLLILYIVDGFFLSFDDVVGFFVVICLGVVCFDVFVSQSGNGFFLLDYFGGRFICLWVGVFGDEECDFFDVVLQMELEILIVFVEFVMFGEELSGVFFDEDDVL